MAVGTSSLLHSCKSLVSTLLPWVGETEAMAAVLSQTGCGPSWTPGSSRDAWSHQGRQGPPGKLGSTRDTGIH